MRWGKYYNKIPTLKEYLGNLLTHAEFLEEIIKENPKRILEVGIGTGGMSIFLSHLGYEVIGIDNDRNVLKNAKKLNKKLNGNAKFLYCDAFKLDKKFPKNFFDVVFSQGFFEHFGNEEIKELLNKQLKLAKKAVIFSVPSKYYGQKDFGNERLMSVKEWRKILKKFPIKSIFEYGSCFSIRKPAWTIWKVLGKGIFMYKDTKTSWG